MGRIEVGQLATPFHWRFALGMTASGPKRTSKASGAEHGPVPQLGAVISRLARRSAESHPAPPMALGQDVQARCNAVYWFSTIVDPANTGWRPSRLGAMRVVF
jgi:hypothetical protein